MASRFSAGFTIIELLTVVAIIAVLVSIVAVNVNNYKNKARDSGIKSTMGQVSLAASAYYEGHGGYGAFCNDNVTQALYNSINSPNKRCKASADRWVVCARLNIPSNGTRAWCIDNTGARKEMNDNQCNNGLNLCP